MAIGAIEFGRYDYESGEPNEEEVVSSLETFFERQRFPWLARALFEEIERFRIRAWIRLRYPGLHRDFEDWAGALRSIPGALPVTDNPVDAVLMELRGAWLGAEPESIAGGELVSRIKERLLGGVDVEETVQLLTESLPLLESLFPDPGRAVASVRVNPLSSPAMTEEQQDRERRLRGLRGAMREEGISTRLEVIRAAVESRGQRNDESYAEILEFLERNPPPDGGLIDPRPSTPTEGPLGQESVGQELRAEGGTLYPEWGEDIEDYRPNWVRVREFPH